MVCFDTRCHGDGKWGRQRSSPPLSGSWCSVAEGLFTAQAASLSPITFATLSSPDNLATLRRCGFYYLLCVSNTLKHLRLGGGKDHRVRIRDEFKLLLDPEQVRFSLRHNFSICKMRELDNLMFCKVPNNFCPYDSRTPCNSLAIFLPLSSAPRTLEGRSGVVEDNLFQEIGGRVLISVTGSCGS